MKKTFCQFLKMPKKDKILKRKTRTRDDDDFSEQEDERSNDKRETDVGKESGLEIIEDSDNDDDSDSDESKNKIFERHLRSMFNEKFYGGKNLCTKNNYPSSENIKTFFLEIAANMLLSISLADDDSKNEKRGVNLTSTKSRFVTQMSGQNTSVYLKEFPPKASKIKKISLKDCEKKTKGKSYYIFTGTSSILASYKTKKGESHEEILGFLVRGVLEKIFEVCSEEDIEKLVNKEGVITFGNEVVSSDLLETSFSDEEDGTEKSRHLIEVEERMKRFEDVINLYEPVKKIPEELKVSEDVFTDLYTEAENEARDPFNFYHAFMPCVIPNGRFKDPDTLEALVSFPIKDFHRYNKPDSKNKDNTGKVIVTLHNGEDTTLGEHRFVMMITTRLSFLDFVESYTLPGAAMTLALREFTKVMNENKIQCYISFRGEDPYGRDLGELYINGKNYYLTMKKLKLKHKGKNGELQEIMCDYDGRRVSTLSKNFEKKCNPHYTAKETYITEDKKVKKLSKKYQAILERIFIGDEDPKIVGKEYNKTLTEA